VTARNYESDMPCCRCGRSVAMREPDCAGLYDDLDRPWCYACAAQELTGARFPMFDDNEGSG